MPPGPKRAPAAARGGGGNKRQPPKAHLPEGFELTDLKKRVWRVGRVIGEGGFGLVYLGSSCGGASGPPIECVIKAEPKGNGPLFCEMHFYQRAADGTRVTDWARQRGLDYVGVPRFYGCGHASHGGLEHRFLAIERLGEDLERRFERSRDPQGRLSPRLTFSVAVRVLDALEFVHDSGYAHADVKASNLLTSADPKEDRVYLADYGLAFRYFAEGKWLKEEKEDPKRRHDGTAEFCSRDAHRGLAPTPRADLENLGWCLVTWLTGPLPWEAFRGASERVQRAKEEAIADLAGFLRGREFLRRPVDADAVRDLLAHSASLRYHERPDYRRMRDLLRKRADAPGCCDDAAASPPAAKKLKTSADSLNGGHVAKATSPRTKVVAKAASPRPKAVAKATSPRTKAVAKATSPRTKAVAKARSPRAEAVAKAVSPKSSETPVEHEAAPPSRKRKSGFCQTSPHLLKEAKRLARGAAAAAAAAASAAAASKATK